MISIDTNPEAIEITSKNLKQFGLGDNVTLINDDGANALKDIDDIDIAIVGAHTQWATGIYTKQIQSIVKRTHAFVFILPTNAPEISATVKPAKAHWNITNNNVGIDPVKSSNAIPCKKKFDGEPISPLISLPNANW